VTEPSLTTLIGDEIHWRDKRWDFVDGKDGFFYGIPSNALRVVKFNPLDKSLLTEIVGPDLGEGECKWWCGGVWCASQQWQNLLHAFYIAAIRCRTSIQWYNSPLTIGKMKYSTTNTLLSSY
jgi:hypothetical protein